MITLKNVICEKQQRLKNNVTILNIKVNEDTLNELINAIKNNYNLIQYLTPDSMKKITNPLKIISFSPELQKIDFPLDKPINITLNKIDYNRSYKQFNFHIHDYQEPDLTFEERLSTFLHEIVKPYFETKISPSRLNNFLTVLVDYQCEDNLDIKNFLKQQSIEQEFTKNENGDNRFSLLHTLSIFNILKNQGQKYLNNINILLDEINKNDWKNNIIGQLYLFMLRFLDMDKRSVSLKLDNPKLEFTKSEIKKNKPLDLNIKFKLLLNSFFEKSFLYYLLDKNKELGISKNSFLKAIDEFGIDAIKVLKQKPFALTIYRNPKTKLYKPILTWEEAEGLINSGIAKYNEKQHIVAALRLSYKDITLESGSTMVNYIDLLVHAYKNYLHSQKKYESLVKSYFQSESIDLNIFEQYLENDSLDKNTRKFFLVKNEQNEQNKTERWVSSYEDFVYLEYNLMKLLHLLLTSKQNSYFTTEDVEKFKKDMKNNPKPLDEKQMEAVLLAMRSKVMYLTGGAGTGKTRTIEAILSAYQNYCSGDVEVLMAAPTGKAAQRITESTGFQAHTIHRLFNLIPDTVEEDGVQRGALGHFHQNHQYDSKSIFKNDKNYILIIDESSMISFSLAINMLANLQMNKTNVIFVGDVNQLPPIEKGSFFRDIIESKVIQGIKLNVLHRINDKSLVALNAKNIKDHLPCILNDDNTIKQSDDFCFISANSDEEILKKIIELNIQLKENNVPLKDIQILSPQNNGDLGINNLNEQLKAIFNSTGQRINGVLSYDDKVIHTQNNRDLNVFNGMVGFIRQDTLMDNQNSSIPVVFGDKDTMAGEKTVVYEKNEDIQQLNLAYALTVHKSQGSDYPFVIMPLSIKHKNITRALLYTALTRTKRKIFLIGDERFLKDPTFLSDGQQRHTQLKNILKQKENKFKIINSEKMIHADMQQNDKPF